MPCMQHILRNIPVSINKFWSYVIFPTLSRHILVHFIMLIVSDNV